jgi:hypothetical protein
MCPGYSFFTEFCPGIRFCSLTGFLREQILDRSSQRPLFLGPFPFPIYTTNPFPFPRTLNLLPSHLQSLLNTLLLPLQPRSIVVNMWEETSFASDVPAPTLLIRLLPLTILHNYSSQHSTVSPSQAVDVPFDPPSNSLILNPQDINMCLFREKVI